MLSSISGTQEPVLNLLLLQEGEERGGGLHEAAHEAGQGESLRGK